MVYSSLRNVPYYLLLVFGWSTSSDLDALPRTAFTAEEREEGYLLPVGFIKGRIFAFDANIGNVEFNIRTREGTAGILLNYMVHGYLLI